MNLLNIVQHTSADYLGLMEDHLEGRRIRFRYFRPFTEQGSVPAPGDGCDGLVLLGGGPWGSAGTRNVPTLQQEIALTRGTLDQASSTISSTSASGSSTSKPIVLSTQQRRSRKGRSKPAHAELATARALK